MFSLNKSERLCGKSSTTELFLNGSSINDDSFRLIFLAQDYTREVYFKSQFIVPKKHVSRAVDRNFVKRQMREALRKNKTMLIDLLQKNSKQLNFAIIYQISEIKETCLIEEKIKSLIIRLIKKL
jgi:ribonuclease P protein component